MDADTLLENFEILAEAPGGIGFLKKLILVNAASGAFLQNGRHSGSANSKKTLGELCDIYQPKTISIRELTGDGKYLAYGANGVIGRYGKFNHEFEEVLVTCRGATCGTVNVSSPKSWINGNAMVVRPKTNGLSKEFLAVILRGVDYASVITGTAQPQITRQPLSKISIFVPTVAEQKRIVTKVDGLMALCDQLEQQQKHRDNLRTATRKSAIDAIATATTPEELEAAWKRINNNWEVIADTPESIASLRSLILDLAVRGKLVSSDERTWRSATLGQVVEIIRGVTFPASAKHRSPGKGLIPCLRTTNVQNEVDWDDLLYISKEYVRKVSQYVQLDDVLISMANSRELVGKVALVRRDDIPCTLGGFIAAIRCGETILPRFLIALLRVPTARKKLIDSSNQTTNIANISLGRLNPLELLLPPIAEQKRIVSKIDELMALCDELEHSLLERNELKKKIAGSLAAEAAA